MLAHPQKAANADHNAVDLPGLFQQNFTELAELLVLIVVNVYADQL